MTEVLEVEVGVSGKAVTDVMALFTSIIDQYIVDQEGIVPDYMEVEIMHKLPQCEVTTKIRVDFTTNMQFLDMMEKKGG